MFLAAIYNYRLFSPVKTYDNSLLLPKGRESLSDTTPFNTYPTSFTTESKLF